MCGYGMRPSQFVLTYGVGSIIETSNGPRLIPDFDRWGEIFRKGSDKNVLDFQIDISLHRGILKGNVFEVPTNVLLGRNENEDIYSTIAFPDWGLCVEHGYLFEYDGNRTGCPGCGRTAGAGREHGVRFVRACPHGHLDDVNWGGLVHDKSCNSRVCKWDEVDGTLGGTKITCKSCKKVTTLADVYYKTSRCSGRFPESDRPNVQCTQKSQVIPRGSSMLRIPSLLSIIAIPGPDSPLHGILGRDAISSILLSKNGWTKKELIERITTLNENRPGSVPAEDIEAIRKESTDAIKGAIAGVAKTAKSRPSSMGEMRMHEFGTLRDAAKYGHPVNRDSDPYFSVPKKRVRSDDNGNAITISKRKLRVSPIEKLRVITIQQGYQRLGTEEDPDDNGISHQVVKTYYKYNGKNWYPGIEQIGEGIFIDGHDDDLGIVSKRWEEFFNNSKTKEFHPVFVWWHSLAHRIISAISLHSGYSPASIREMVYADTSSETPRGGVLLYTSQPGGDGSLGGLVSKVPKFERVIEQALTDLESCSNDPLCYEQDVEDIGSSGAACYACLYLSETSCSYFNRFLDRKILLENPL